MAMVGKKTGFQSRAVVQLGDPGEYRLMEPLSFFDGLRTTYLVEKGFITDFASIPRLLRALPSFDPSGVSREPAILHDRLYCGHGRIGATVYQPASEDDEQPWVSVNKVLTRAEADALFHRALLAVGMSPLAAWFHYLGVRMGGWIYWTDRAEGLESSDFNRSDQ